MTETYIDANDFILKKGKELLEFGGGVETTNSKNAGTLKDKLYELPHQFFSIANPQATLFNIGGFKTTPFWMAGELLTEFLNENPPIMTKYREDVIHQSYEMKLTGDVEYSYGSRWKEFNQILHAYEVLKANPNSKRVLIQTWVPWDMDRNKSDVPCFPGKTKIISPQGDIEIEKIYDIINNKKEKYPIFSVNIKTKNVEIKWIKNAFKRGIKSIYRVYFDNNDYVDATEEHEFYIKRMINRHWEYIKIKLKDLKKGDRIVPFTIFIKNKGLAFIKNLSENWSYKNQQNLAREYFKFFHKVKLSSNIDIHHKDINCYNNDINNLDNLNHIYHSSETQKNNNRMKQPNECIKQSKKLKSNRDMKMFGEKHGLQNTSEYQNITKDILINIGRKMYNDLKIFNKSIWLKQKNNYGLKIGIGGIAHINKFFNTFSEFNLIVRNNHKVSKIVKLKKNKIVYDIEVEGNHNFFIRFNNLNNFVYDKKNLKSMQLGCLVSNCNINYMFLGRDNKLDMTATIRSNDILRGTKYDYALASFMLQSLASWTEMDVGKLFFSINSLHIYERDKAKLEEVLNSGEHTPSPKIIVPKNLTIEEFWHDFRHVGKAEAASYHSAFDYFDKYLSDMKIPFFRDLARIYGIRNAKFIKNYKLEDKYKSEVETPEMRKWLKL